MSAPAQPRLATGTVELEPDVLLPSQVGSQNPIHLGVRKLMAEVLRDAVDVVMKHGAVAGPRRQDVRRDIEWFESHDRAWPFSFERICEALGLDPSYIRAGLHRRLSREPVDAPSVPAAPRRWGGHRFCALRHSLGLTQNGMAARLDVRRQLLSQWELDVTPIPDRHAPTLDALEQAVAQRREATA